MSKINLERITLHYQCLGQGEDLVLIHGLGANLAFWYPGIASVLSESYRVIVYDLRGHGRSEMTDSGYTIEHMVEDLEALLEHLEVTKCHIIGHSFGGRIALRYAILHPERVNSLAIADTRLYCFQPEIRLRDWNYWPTVKQRLRSKNSEIPSDDELISFHLLKRLSLLAPELKKKQVNRPANGNISLKTQSMGKRGTQRWDKLMTTTTAKEEFEDSSAIAIEDIKRITIPTLTIYGEHSHCLPSCDRLNKLIDRTQTFTVPDAGHFHPVSKPKQFLNATQPFLLSTQVSTVTV